MANRFDNPLPFFDDSTGAPYEGAQLFFYASGTSTKLDTYSDPDLAVPHANTNPIVLNSAGRVPNAVFLQNLAYKVVLAPADDTDPPTSPIWTQDPVYTSDYSAAAQFTSGSGNPNGSVAGSAGSATIKASAYWDYTNNILYICTTTGTTTTAVWTAINSSTAAAVVPPPQGYLTPTSGTPVINADVVAATAIYYTPYNGVLVPIYNGASFIPTSIVSELSLTLTSSHVASNIYDLFIFSNNGVATLGSGPSWSAGTAGSITAGSCARGTGAGGSAISRVNGLYTNTVSMTIRYGNGTTTATANANTATYVGTLFIDGTNGQVSCYVTVGQNRKWGLWNAFNRQTIETLVSDSTSSWTNQTNVVRQSNGAAGNKTTVLCGLAEEIVDNQFMQTSSEAFVSNTGGASIGIGWNATNAFSGRVGASLGANVTTTGEVRSDMVAYYKAPPFLGIANVATCEDTANVAATVTYFGQSSMQMSSKWRG